MNSWGLAGQFFMPLRRAALHISEDHLTENWCFNNHTDFPAYSDTLGTREKCHCKRGVTVTTSFLYMKGQLGTVKTVTVTGVLL